MVGAIGLPQYADAPARTGGIAFAFRVLAEFSTAHDGWLVSLDILSPDIGAQPDIKKVTAQHLDRWRRIDLVHHVRLPARK